jgi:hypothetical protein
VARTELHEDDVQRLATCIAHDWLTLNEYCVCANQVWRAYTYFLPIVERFRRELECGCEGCVLDATEGIYDGIAEEAKRFERFLHPPIPFSPVQN